MPNALSRRSKVPARRRSLHQRTPPTARRFDELLVQSGKVSPGDMFRAITLQQVEDATLADLVSGLELTTEAALTEAQAQAAALPLVDLVADPPSTGILYGPDPAQMLRNRFVPWRRFGATLVVAIADPAQGSEVRSLLSGQADRVEFVTASPSQIEAAIVQTHRTALSHAANTRTDADRSCRKWAQGRPARTGAVLLGLLIVCLLAAPGMVILFALFWFAAALLLNGLFKAAMLWSALTTPARARAGRRPAKLPKISILVPLLRETDILDRLIGRMNALIYPRELLEIVLIYEETDPGTRDHLMRRDLPHWIRTLEVPENTLQTKPRAMNYALDFCKGDLIGIYDAEDAPDPNQLFQVVRRFGAAASDVACVQCALDYYNATTNWISRCFTIEYAIHFRVMLPGLERLRLPIPLGGTSVFFRRSVLEELGRWDAQNVTEDADLGYRLHRAGYRCLLADSTTYEEANFRVVPWIKQRSRWLKGFLQTWMTHSRNPLQLMRDLGPLSFFVLQAQMLGTFTSFAMAPIVLPLWLMSIGLSSEIYGAAPTWFLSALIIGFLTTEVFLAILGTVACSRRPAGGLHWWVLTLPAYWPIGACAAAKATWELFAKPSYWDKTPHGINDAVYQSEIDKLTTLPETVNRATEAACSGTGG